MKLIILVMLVQLSACSTMIPKEEAKKEIVPTCIYEEIIVQPKQKYLIKEPPCFKDSDKDTGMLEEIPCPVAK